MGCYNVTKRCMSKDGCMRKTKIICTIGPASRSEQMLSALIDAGMNVARLNMSHGDHQWHGETIALLKRLREEKGVPLAIMLDTKGPEIRLGDFEGGSVELTAGQRFTLVCGQSIMGTAERASVTYDGLCRDVAVGTHVLIDDGLIEMSVESVEGGSIVCSVLNGGTVSDHKGINVPGAKLRLPAVTERDIDDIRFGCAAGIDLVAASFVRKAADVLELRHVLESAGAQDVQIYAKIENEEGVKNVDEIITLADGLMVARGDLGVEVPIQEVPLIQKGMIAKCNRMGKPVITATQMLDSMMRNPRPTRAEVSDVANSILDGTDCIMLSGETASGRYPLEALKTMVRIAEHVENHRKAEPKGVQESFETNFSITNAVSYACTTIAADLNASAIITPTYRGSTARKVSKYRPGCTLIATTENPRVFNQLSCVWGVMPLMVAHSDNTDEMVACSIAAAQEHNFLSVGDVAIVTAGVPVGMSGTTNLIRVHVIGDVLLRGRGIGETPVVGRVCVAHTLAEAASNFTPGDILVARRTDNSFLPYLRKASGVIVECEGSACHASIAALTLEIPVIHSAESACSVLRTGTTITLDPVSGYVYNGEAHNV